MKRKRKKGIGTLAVLCMLLMLSHPVMTAQAAYAFGYTETGSSFYFTNLNNYYSMILSKINNDYVKVTVDKIEAGVTPGGYKIRVFGTNTNTVNTGAECGSVIVYFTGTQFITNYVYENGYSLCYLKICGTNNSVKGICCGTWDPNNY